MPLAVVGAGAAGLLASIFAGRAGVPVLLLETRPKPGAKIRVSGGGRCNLLPSRASLEDYATGGSLYAVRNVLFSWPLLEVRAFFEKELGIPLKTEPSGKVFPRSEDPREVVRALLEEASRVGVRLLAPFRTVSIERSEEGFELQSDAGRKVLARRVVLATGGLSLPRTGSEGLGFEIARALGHRVREPYPALVPLLSKEGEWTELAGVSTRVRLRAVRGKEVIEERTGDLLFTHRGFSGPVVLDMSRHVTAPGSGDVRLEVDWIGAGDVSWRREFLRGGTGTVSVLLRRHLPKRLAVLLLRRAGVDPARKIAELRREERERILGVLEGMVLPVSGSEGYATAEVTAGGVPLEEVDLKTLESRVSAGLHFAGEILDVVGRIGGYNFLWAFVSGRRAGEGAARLLRTRGKPQERRKTRGM